MTSNTVEDFIEEAHRFISDQAVFSGDQITALEHMLNQIEAAIQCALRAREVT